MIEQSDKVQAAVEKVKALREVERTTGCRTTRTQRLILRSLNEAELTAVALLLAEHPSEECNG